MASPVTVRTQRNQILFSIFSRMASETTMVHLQAVHAAASLAAPTVSLQNLTVQDAIAGRI
jgi:hypothetical protein